MRRYRSVVARIVARTSRRFGNASPDLIDDLVQDAFLKICADHARILRGFEPRHEDSIFGLLKTVAFSVTHDHFRRRLAVVRGGGQASQQLDDYLENAAGCREGEMPADRRILLEQIGGFLHSNPEVTSRDRTIFWLFYRQGMTGREIASIPSTGLSQKGVEAVLHRVSHLVRAWIAAESPRATSPGPPQKGKATGNAL